MMKKLKVLGTLLAILGAFAAQAATLKTGSWRFELKTTYANIPFVMDLQKDQDGYSALLHNGKEEIKLTGITQKKNHLSIPLQAFENSLELEIASPEFVKGYLVRHNKNPKIEIPVFGKFGETKRFPGDRARALAKLDGKWQVSITDADGKATQGVVVLEQKGDALYGSILTPTGDYRYFEGYVTKNDFVAASFDGVYNYSFSGTVKKGTLKASIRDNSISNLTGTFDTFAKLPDAYNQTKLEKLAFSFPDLGGKFMSLESEKFKNKPVIVQFYGSWCPNCMDETNFLIPWYKSNAEKKKVEIVALAFERSLSEADAKKQLKKVIAKYEIPYTVLLAGSTSDEKPMDKIKGLKNFISFPTTVFLNKKHEVVKVHAGFTGPSTGDFFKEWKKDFEKNVDLIRK